ncbi:MAG: SDR family oxidoreductase [Alphaproteobacteria bacterium]|nr:SDR family oxidoreductase [Alphaproteobacteria bacterium]
MSGRKAVVTGASGRIGRALALGLQDSGAMVVGIDTRPDSTGDIEIVARDVSDPACSADIVEELDDKQDGIDIWVNAAYPRTVDWGVEPGRESVDSWVQNVTLQLTANCTLSTAIATRMSKRERGSIINIASIYGLVSPDFTIYEGTEMGVPAPYSAIKGGLINHTRYLAGFFGSQGVRVNVLAPGGVEAGQPKEFVTAYCNRTALKRLAKPEDLVGPVVFLASDASAYISGICLPVDGGWTAI